MKYTIFIDETGSFSRDVSAKSFVGGWVSKEYNEKNIKIEIEHSLLNLNARIADKYGETYKFLLNRDMHFVPLHRKKERIGKDANIKAPEEMAEDICSTLFNSIKKNVEFIFRSSGNPKYFANEQASYLEIIRSTIIQILREDLLKKNCEEINIIIASRRVAILMGKESHSSSDKIKNYEASILSLLEEEILDILGKNIKGTKINLKIESVDQNLGLRIADFFCGAQKKSTQINYLKDYSDIKKVYSIHNSFLYIPTNDILAALNYKYTNDQTGAIITAIESLAIKHREGVKNLLNKFIDDINKENLSLLYEDLRIYFNNELSSPDRYENLKFLERFLEILDSKLEILKEKEINTYESLKALVIKNKLKVMSHSGSLFNLKSNNNLFKEYINLIENNGSQIYGSIFKALQEKHEATLTYATIVFNSFDFESILDNIKNELDVYQKLLQNLEKPDNNLAKLEGTLGQIYAFKASSNNNKDKENDFLKAEEYFLLDKKHLTKKIGKDINQINGYLTTLSFKKQDLESLIKNFLEETNSQDTKIEDIYDFNKTDSFSSEKDSFMLLHRLYVCSLAQKINNTEIKNLKILEKKVISNLKIEDYPNFLILKWLANIYIQKGNMEKAFELLSKLTFENITSKNFTIEFIKLPIKMQLIYLEQKMKKNPSHILLDEIHKFEKFSSDIKNKIKDLGIRDYINKDIKDWDIFELCNIMPFYYS
jgi:hypothetical protein